MQRVPLHTGGAVAGTTAASSRWDKLPGSLPNAAAAAAAGAGDAAWSPGAHSANGAWPALGRGSTDWKLVGLSAKLATSLKTNEDLRKRVADVEAAAARAAARAADADDDARAARREATAAEASREEATRRIVSLTTRVKAGLNT
jgi:hypothetical protein